MLLQQVCGPLLRPHILHSFCSETWLINWLELLDCICTTLDLEEYCTYWIHIWVVDVDTSPTLPVLFFINATTWT